MRRSGPGPRIREADRYADGRFDLVAVGTERFRIEEVFTDREPYLVARVAAIDEEIGDEGRAGRLARIATRRFVRYVDQVRELAEEDDETAEAEEDDDEPVVGWPSPSAASTPVRDESDERTGPPILGIPADPTLLSHLLAGIVELDLPTRQRLLEALTTEDRLDALNLTLGQRSRLPRAAPARLHPGPTDGGRPAQLANVPVASGSARIMPG